MNIKQLRILYLVITSLLWAPSNSSASEATKTFCAGTYEISVFNNGKKFQQADEGCRGRGGYLVKLNNDVLNDVIRNIGQNVDYTVGITKCGSNFCWWNDYSIVDSTIPWNSGQPGPGNCVYIRNGRLGTYNCDGELFYMCQTPNKQLPITSVGHVTITNALRQNVLCSVTKCPPIWISNGTNVAKSGSQGSARIFQHIYSVYSRLWFINPNEQDSGIYRCTSSPDKATYRAVFVKVHGRPTINAIVIPDLCSSNVTLLWTPSKQAVNFTHSISVKNVGTFMVTPINNREQRFLISGLNSSTIHRLSVTTCKRNCTGNFSPSTVNFTTAGIPDEIAAVKIQKISNTFCRVSWTAPPLAKNVTGYKIRITESSISFRASVPINRTWELETTKTSYIVEGKPNFKLIASVSAINCAGMGRFVESTLQCKIVGLAPRVVEEPQIQMFEALTMPLVSQTIPNEDLGLMSCLLVFIRNATDESVIMSKSEYTALDFKQRLDMHGGGSEYLTFAIPASRFLHDDKVLRLSLGDDSSSSCNLSEALDTRLLSPVTFPCGGEIACATNKKLKKDSYYRIYTVAVAPIENSLLSVTRSRDALFNTKKQETETVTSLTSDTPDIIHSLGLAPIAGIAAGGAVFVALILGVLICWKRRPRQQNPSDAYEITNQEQQKVESAPTESYGSQQQNPYDEYEIPIQEQHKAGSVPPKSSSKKELTVADSSHYTSMNASDEDMMEARPRGRSRFDALPDFKSASSALISQSEDGCKVEIQTDGDKVMYQNRSELNDKVYEEVNDNK